MLGVPFLALPSGFEVHLIANESSWFPVSDVKQTPTGERKEDPAVTPEHRRVASV